MPLLHRRLAPGTVVPVTDGGAISVGAVGAVAVGPALVTAVVVGWVTVGVVVVVVGVVLVVGCDSGCTGPTGRESSDAELVPLSAVTTTATSWPTSSAVSA
jgi:hypothetical protein